jgi:hypothetical protein
MILNDTQNQEVLKLFQDLKNNGIDLPQDINPLNLIQEIFLNFESYDEDLKNVEYDLRENFLNCLDTEHFIYYIDAIDYLREEDPSLRQSLDIAKEFGITDICSSTLANLLYHQKEIEIIDKIDFELIIETIIKNQ